VPYAVGKSGKGYKVKNKQTGRTYSKKSMSKKKAERQQRAIYANSKGKK